MYEFKLPDVGEGIHEREILKWHVEPGAEVKEDEPLVDVETDKAAITIPSPRSGKLVSRNGNVGDTVLVGEVLVVIDDGTGPAEAAPPAAPPKEAAAPERPPAAPAAPPSDKKPPAAPAAAPANPVEG